MKTIHSDVRIILLALSALAGIFARSNFQITWALIEIYVIIEQIYLLFCRNLNSRLNWIPK